jgi:ubiquinone biosynthesis protein COQ4
MNDTHEIRWRDGWQNLVYLYRHPYDTTKIASVIEAFQGRSLQRLLARLEQRPRGQELLTKRPSLRNALADRAWLTSLPEGSLGRTYVEYCEREGITAPMTEYVDAGTNAHRTERLSPNESFIQDFLFHSHDIYHIVTGYRTVLVGEICLLLFTSSQLRNTGVYAMAMLGLYSLRLPRLEGQRIAMRAFARGLEAEWLPEQNWVELMPEPLEEIRRRLRLDVPHHYEPLYIGKNRKKSVQPQL